MKHATLLVIGSPWRSWVIMGLCYDTDVQTVCIRIYQVCYLTIYNGDINIDSEFNIVECKTFCAKMNLHCNHSNPNNTTAPPLKVIQHQINIFARPSTLS